MRIALLNQFYPPSDAPTGLLLDDLGRALAASGHRVEAICSDRDYNDPTLRYPAIDQVGGVEVRRVGGTRLGRGSRAGRAIDYLNFLTRAGARLLAGRRADVVVVLTTPPMLAAPVMAVAALKRTRVVFWVMDVYPDLAFELGVIRRESAGGRLLSALSSRLLRAADVVVALGETMATRLGEAGARRVETVHNWADGEAIRPLPTDGHALRRAWGWNARTVVQYSGNMGLAHEFDTVLDAAAGLLHRPEILFAFVGGGPRRAEVEQQARRRGLRNVEFRPWVAQDRLGESLTAGDVHLVTLRPGLEGLLVPSKIYGILAAGRPTLYVGPARCEVGRIVEQGCCGIRVERGDAAELARCIERYADDRALRDEHGRAARETFERSFDRRRALSRLCAIVTATDAD
ncbi:MAG TPA: glycosyltransferase family 4 protein [Candidatus Polarisedimenticolaceae bacterium]|nr:glycosyltransferase family 4 protein [Candidatus Polarisedimenticolaceae bacterium]